METGGSLDAPLLSSKPKTNNDDGTTIRDINTSDIMRPPTSSATVSDGYSRTDQRLPIATSYTPVAPPIDFDYNDGVADQDFDGSASGSDNYGATTTTTNANAPPNHDDDDESGDYNIHNPLHPSQTGIDYHLPHPSHPHLEATHEGEHRYDLTSSGSSGSGRGGSNNSIPITNSTKLFAFCAALNSCNLGYDIGVNTGAGPMLQSSLNLSNVQLELFMGAIDLFAMLGALSSNYIADAMGRRWAFRVSAVIFILGTAIQSASYSYATLMIGRTLVGLGVGFGLAVDPVYISEISTAAHRGQLVTWSEIAINIGIVLGFASGLCTSVVEEDIAWRIMFAAGVILPCFVIYFATFVMPESPRWLVSKDRDAEAKEVLKLAYPEGYNVDIIVRKIKEGIAAEAIAEHAVGWDVIFFPTPAFKRMIFVGVGTAIAQQAVGIDAIQYFLVYILDETGIARNAQTGILIGLGVIKLCVVVVAGHLFDRMGRRPLFFMSLVGMSISLFLVSFGFVGGATSEKFAVFGLALYLAFFSLGMGPGAWLIPSEVFSTMIRAKAMSVATFMNRATATIVSSTFLSVAKAMTFAGFFILLSLVCLIILVWMYVYLPETKGRSLEDMSQYFGEITGDRSIFEAEEMLYRNNIGGPDSSSLAGATGERSTTTSTSGVEPTARSTQRSLVYEKPPPVDAHIVGTMA